MLLPRLAQPVLALALAAAAAHAGGSPVLKVPQDFATIQAAVDASVDGDTIVVSAGEYPESVVVNLKSDLLIRGKGKVVLAPPSGNGMTITASTHVTVRKLRVEGGAPYGFHVQASTFTELEGCRVEAPVADGVRLEDGFSNTVRKCKVIDAGQYGVAVGTEGAVKADGNNVLGCRLVTPALAGVAVHGGANIVRQCTVKQSLGDGLVIFGATGSQGNLFRDCKVGKPALRGAVLSGTTNVLRHVRIGHCGGDGVSIISASGAVVEQCNLSKMAGTAVDSSADSFGTVFAGVVVSDPGGAGLRIAGGGATATACTITGAAGDGVLIEGSGSLVSGNTANDGDADGFHLTASTSGNTLSKNTAKGNAGFDLDDESNGANTIEDNNHFKTTGP